MEDDGPPGVPEWVVTYGDMMSLLLTFFIMLVSLSEVIADKKFRALMESLHKRFGYQTASAAPPGKNFPLNSMLAGLASLGSYTNEERGHGGIKTKAVDGPDPRVSRNREGDGLPVGEPIPFEPNRAEPVPGFEQNVDAIGRRLAGIPNKIEIRGRCRAAPGLTPEQAWRLCYERARFVRDELLAHNVASDRMRLVCAGATEPSESDDGIELLDRVDVIVLDTHVHEFVGRRDGP